MRSLDGEEGWRRFVNTISPEARHRYHRLNLQISGSEPQLDDVLSISALKAQTLESITTDISLQGAVDYMLAAMFYFELDDSPDFVDGEYHCSGFIFCRIDLSSKGRRQLYNHLVQTASWFLIKGTPVACVEKVPQSLPPFKRRIKFFVESLDEIVGMSIRGTTTTSTPISGFPTTLRKLRNAQQLYSPFGTVLHRVGEKALPVLPCKRKDQGSHNQHHAKRVFVRRSS